MKTKSVRTRGKLRFSDYFQELKNGEKVAVVIEGSSKINFPKRLQGRTGTVEGKRGHAYMVNIKDQAKAKQYIIAPINLKKIKA